MLISDACEITPRECERRDLWKLGHSFWRFFVVALLFDVGFGLYFFLINLYLAQCGMSEKTIGVAAGALTVGNLVATIPNGVVARSAGLRPILMFCLVATPLVGVARVLAIAPVVQVALAFLQGAIMCSYAVCFAPAIAALTVPQNRTFAFSITFGTGIGSGIVGGVVGGAAPLWLRGYWPSLTIVSAMGCVLIAGCGIAILSTIPMRGLVLPKLERSPVSARRTVTTPFARRFLGMIAVWNLAIGGFAPFASLYLSSRLHISLPRVGMIFSAGQLLQVIGVGMAPLIYRRTGKIYGIATLQLGACTALILLYLAPTLHCAVGAYLCVVMFQYMCNPAIYSLWMDATREDLRAAASAAQNLVTSSSVAVGSILAGFVISSRGYEPVFMACASMCTAGATLSWLMNHSSADSKLPEASGIAHP